MHLSARVTVLCGAHGLWFSVLEVCLLQNQFLCFYRIAGCGARGGKMALFSVFSVFAIQRPFPGLGAADGGSYSPVLGCLRTLRGAWGLMMSFRIVFMRTTAHMNSPQVFLHPPT